MNWFPPVTCPLRVAVSPLEGATPAAWQSQFRGVPRTPELLSCEGQP